MDEIRYGKSNLEAIVVVQELEGVVWMRVRAWR